MFKPTQIVTAVVALAIALAGAPATACTNFLISTGASTDGSTMITYAADSHVLYGELYYTPAGVHPPGAKLDVYEWDTGKYLGQIDQVPVTFSVAGNMNEHQVSIGETTWGGRPELRDPNAIVDYGSLMYITLQRAKTAREAIEIMGALVAEYGYYSSGETFSIADPNEVWIMDMIGKGPDNKGAVWVARKVPDGYISAHANAARVREFPLKDKNTLYAPDVISFARDQGYFEGEDSEFSFAEIYNPPRFGARRFCDARVWCMFNRAAPSLDLPDNWARGEEDAEPYPLWIKPDKKLTVADVAGFMRDHFEGTSLDMTADIGAGPYDLPYRWRPLTWKAGEERYLNERATSTQQTGFSFVAQARSWLPDPIGGVLWFSVDDTYSTVYFPVYCGVTEVPYNYAVGTGSWTDVTWESAFWIFNRVSNFAYLRYKDMIKDIQVVQSELESRFMAEQQEVDSGALALYAQSPRLAKDYLTEYSNRCGAMVVARWRELDEQLLYKFLDGNVKNEHGDVEHPGYSEEWYTKIAAATGDHLKVHKLSGERKAEAKAKQKAKTMAESLLALLDARGLEVTAGERERILSTEKPKQLEKWLVRAATAETVADVLDGTDVAEGH
ncbi:MAG: C69 family dipeptidase [Candidatus Latescibacterota bacterium]|nr:MAG: C69 family dipeptidase [Candidatus Latescibacterota bacterium]